MSNSRKYHLQRLLAWKTETICSYADRVQSGMFSVCESSSPSVFSPFSVWLVGGRDGGDYETLYSNAQL